MGGKLAVLSLFFVCLVFIVFISASVAGISEEECVSGGGRWVEKIGCDPREGETCPQFFCKCEQGFQSINGKCEKISDKSLCERSDGIWKGTTCVCPENSIGFNERVGCNYKFEIQTNKESVNGSNNIDIVLIIASLSALIIIIIWAIWKRKK